MYSLWRTQPCGMLRSRALRFFAIFASLAVQRFFALEPQRSQSTQREKSRSDELYPRVDVVKTCFCRQRFSNSRGYGLCAMLCFGVASRVRKIVRETGSSPTRSTLTT